jgi:probable addiction module antidote protein
MIMTKKRHFRKFTEILKEELQDPKFAAAYLNEALNSGDKGVFLIALRDVINARGNIKGFAEKAAISRPSIYRMLSEEGNPTIETLTAIFETMGLKMQITLA